MSPDKQLTDIFINYRRADTSGHAGRLERELSSRFPGRVFMDIHTIEVGTDFAEAINSEVGKCGALIVLIGNQWLDITDPKTGKRRLDNPNDFVALEIAEALKREIRVIPVLVEGAKMPEAEELPASLAALVRRNALEITDTRWDYDVQQLVRVLEKICGDAPPLGGARTGTGDGTNKGTGTGSSTKWSLAKIAIPIAAALIAIVALIVFLSSGEDSKIQTQPAIATLPTQSPVSATTNNPNPSVGQVVVTLAKAEAEILFAFNTARKWEWYLEQSKEGQLEYRWSMYMAADQPAMNEYAVDVIVEKSPGEAPKTGDLKSLLYYAVTTVGTRKPGETEFSAAPDDFLKTNKMVQPDGLKLILKGEGVKSIFADKPNEVLLITLTPEQKAESQATVAVQYHDN